MAGDIVQGDIWWILDDEPFGSEPGFHRPYIVVQNEKLNSSAIKTIVACPLTSNLRLAVLPGNVLLTAGTGGLSLDSVVNVSGITSRDRQRFDRWVGRVGQRDIRRIVCGVTRILDPDG